MIGLLSRRSPGNLPNLRQVRRVLFSDLHGNDAALERLLQHETGLVLIDIELPEHVNRLLARRGLVFTGHQHLPGYWTQAPEGLPFWTSVRQPTRLELVLEHRYLIQIGSLGEPLAPHLPKYLSWGDSWVEWHP